MAITLPDARKLSDEILEALRLRALRGIELGFTQTDLADLLGVSHETVCRWWSDYLLAGLDGLPGKRSGRPLGSGRLLSPEQSAHIRFLISNNSPEALGVASPLWSRRAVRDLIRKECHITLAIRTVGKYLKRWGFTAKRPQRHSSKFTTTFKAYIGKDLCLRSRFWHKKCFRTVSSKLKDLRR